MKTFRSLMVLFLVLSLFLMPVSAFEDTVQRYDVDYNDLWTGTASVENLPVMYPTSNSIKLATGNNILTNELHSSAYFAFTMRSGEQTSIRYYDSGSNSIGFFDMSVLMVTYNDECRYEFVKTGTTINLYIDGTYRDNFVLTSDESEVYFYLAQLGGGASNVVLDDFTTSSVIGMNRDWTQANTYIDASYGIQSQSSFPTDEYMIKVTRPTTGATINTTSLYTGAAGNESGFVRWNRSNIFGSNFGLYHATLYRESNVLYNTHFSIFDTTIQGSTTWGADNYTIDQTPDLAYVIINGDLSTYTYTLRIVDSLQQIKETYTLNAYAGTKNPSIASYTTGTYYAVMSREHKTTGKVDDFAFDTVLISAEGVSPSSYINFNLNQYTLGDTASYTFNFAEDDTSFLTRERVVIIKDGVILDRINAGVSGTRYIDMDELGHYSISLISYRLLTYNNPVVHAGDGAECVEPIDSYINVPHTDYTGNSFEISYLYGRTPILPFIKISKRQIDNTYVDTDWVNLEDSGIVAGTVYTPSLTIFESGTYLIGIYDVDLLSDDNSLLIASDTIRIYYQDAIEQIYITESKIDTNNVSEIGLGDTLTGNYQVDSINYTNMSIRLEVYNYENDIISFSVPRQKQKGTYQAPLSNQEYFSEYIDGVNVVYKVDSLFYTGNNQVRLAGYNPDGTYNQTIVSTNFTIDLVNSAGYSLTLSKYSVVQNEEFLISVKCPTESTLNIWDSDGNHIKEFIVAGNKDIKFSLPDVDKYYFALQDPTSKLQSSQQLTVLESITDGDGDTGLDDGYTQQDTITMIITFLSMPAFWGMIIWVGVVGGASQSNAVNTSSTGYIAFAFGNILAIVGLFAPYTMYILVILWIGAGVFFKLGRNAAGSEEY